MKRNALPLLGLTLLAGCAGLTPTAGVPPLEGTVELDSERHVMADVSEVANGATVSFIDPTSGNTLTTGLTDSRGRFSLVFSNGNFHPTNGPYFLEAAKGLSMGGSTNRAGATLVRLRTLVSYQNGIWQTPTGMGINIGRATTALCVLSNLKGLTSTQNLALLNRVFLGTPSSAEGIGIPDSFQGDDTLTSTEFIRAYDLVDRAIAQNMDPVAALFKRPAGSTSVTLGPGFATRPELGMALDGWVLGTASPTSGPANTLVTVYGHGLSANAADLGVTLNGQTASVLAASADGTSLRFQVPAGLSPGTYPIVVTYGPWSSSILTFTVTP
ncbi:MAG TPA: IPT/TIG domain-containing protein [Stenomitos sp.]